MVHIARRRLLFLMHAARFLMVFIWIAVLGTGYFDAGRYLRSVELIAEQGPWPSERITVLGAEIKQLQSSMADERIRVEAISQILVSLDKRLTLVDERQQQVLRRLDKSEAFWSSLQEKFLWAVVGQIGVLFVWFLLGHDLMRRMKEDHAAAYKRISEKYPDRVESDDSTD